MILPFHLAMSQISTPRPVLLRRNINLLRAIQIVQSFMVAISIIVVFFQYRGFGLADVMILQAVFAAVMVLVEMPSGYFSNVVGRRRTMIIGSIFIALGWWCYPWATTFAAFLGAETLLVTYRHASPLYYCRAPTFWWNPLYTSRRAAPRA